MPKNVINFSKARDGKHGEKFRLLQAEYYQWQFEQAHGRKATSNDELFSWLSNNPRVVKAEGKAFENWIDEHPEIASKYM